MELCPNCPNQRGEDDKFADWKTRKRPPRSWSARKNDCPVADQKKIQRVLRRVPGRKPMPVFNPDDIEALRVKTVEAEPFYVGEQGSVPEAKALARRRARAS